MGHVTGAGSDFLLRRAFSQGDAKAFEVRVALCSSNPLAVTPFTTDLLTLQDLGNAGIVRAYQGSITTSLSLIDDELVGPDNWKIIQSKEDIPFDVAPSTGTATHAVIYIQSRDEQTDQSEFNYQDWSNFNDPDPTKGRSYLSPILFVTELGTSVTVTGTNYVFPKEDFKVAIKGEGLSYPLPDESLYFVAQASYRGYYLWRMKNDWKWERVGRLNDEYSQRYPRTNPLIIHKEDRVGLIDDYAMLWNRGEYGTDCTYQLNDFFTTQDSNGYGSAHFLMASPLNARNGRQWVHFAPYAQYVWYDTSDTDTVHPLKVANTPQPQEPDNIGQNAFIFEDSSGKVHIIARCEDTNPVNGYYNTLWHWYDPDALNSFDDWEGDDTGLTQEEEQSLTIQSAYMVDDVIYVATTSYDGLTYTGWQIHLAMYDVATTTWSRELVVSGLGFNPYINMLHVHGGIEIVYTTSDTYLVKRIGVGTWDSPEQILSWSPLTSQEGVNRVLKLGDNTYHYVYGQSGQLNHRFIWYNGYSWDSEIYMIADNTWSWRTEICPSVYWRKS